MALQEPLQGFAQIAHEMESIGHLDSLWRPTRRTISILWGTITGDDFDTGVLFEPSGERVCRTIAEHVNGLVAFQIHEQRSIGLPFAKGEIVHPQDLGCGVT